MNESPVRYFIYAWLALLTLLALALGSAYVHLGSGNVLANIAIAFLKAAIVMRLFMRAFDSGPFVRLLAFSGVVWLSIMIGLGLTDYVTRGGQASRVHQETSAAVVHGS